MASGSLGNGDTLGLTQCTQDSHPSLPTHVPRLRLHLTFLHGDGGLLLSQAQQDEEEDKRDEDLKSQDPLEREDHMRPSAHPLPVQGWT